MSSAATDGDGDAPPSPAVVVVGGALPPVPRLALEVALAPPQAANQADANADHEQQQGAARTGRVRIFGHRQLSVRQCSTTVAGRVAAGGSVVCTVSEQATLIREPLACSWTAAEAVQAIAASGCRSR